MTNDKNEERAQDAALYALGALSESERREFEARASESDETTNEVTAMTETAALLGLAVEPVEPSPELKRNIMAQLTSTPQLPREAPQISAVQAAAEHQAPPAALQLKTQSRWFSRSALALTAAAAAAALVIGGGVITNVLGDVTFQQQQADQLAAINAADDLQRAEASIETGGTATLVWSAELGSSALIVEGLQPLPGDKTYELWYIRSDGTAVPAGLFSAVGDEPVWRVLEGEMVAGDTVGVTIEPRGGSEQPTTPPIVAITSA